MSQDNDRTELISLLVTRASPHRARDSVRDLATSAHRTLLMAQSLAMAGRNVDLTGLDAMVGRVTAQMLDLDPAEGRALRPTLQAMLDTLGRLENALQPKKMGGS